jgi:hypothetical protein
MQFSAGTGFRWQATSALQGCQMVFFSDQKSRFGYMLEDPVMKNVVIYSDHLEYFTTIGYILWAFGNFINHLVYFSPLWYIVPIKIWQPCYSAGIL